MLVRNLILLMSLAWFGQSISASDIFDRLVLEVNKTSYSQRQVEIYIGTRNVLAARSADVDVSVNSRNWQDILFQFRDEMMVEQEAQRLGTVQPNLQMVDELFKVLRTKQKRVRSLTALYQRLNVDSAEVRTVLASIIRVRGFLVTKRRQGASDLKQLNIEKSVGWFRKLTARVPSRVYEGALSYVPIKSERKKWSHSP